MRSFVKIFAVVVVMEHKEVGLVEAVDYVIHKRLWKSTGGLVAVSSIGDMAMAFNTTGMFQACTEGGAREIGTIWHWMIQNATNQTSKLFFSEKEDL